MAWVTITTDTTGAVDLGASDSLFLAPDVTLSDFTPVPAVSASGTDQWILLYGTLQDGSTLLGGSPVAVSAVGTTDLTIEIAETGWVAAEDAIFLVASVGTVIENEGTIVGSNTVGSGLSVFGSVRTFIVNTGEIDGATAVYVWGGSNATTLVNLGVISGNTAYYEDGSGEDVVVNAGQIFGTVLLGGGDDLFDGRPGETFGDVYGGDGNDRLLGGVADDYLYGDGGNDILAGGEGADWLDGGDGQDVAHFGNARAGVVASLAGTACGCGSAEGDVFIDIERLAGSRFADWLEGDDGNNVLAGGDGNDTLLGGLGRDTLVGGAGADELIGGDGIDRAGYGTATAGVVASLDDPTANTGDAAGDTYLEIEGLVGSAWDDDLRGDAGANTLWGGLGDDSLTGGRGQDTLYGGAGADSFVFASSLGTAHADRIADFETGVDVIVLDRAVFGALALGALDAGAFAANADGVAAGTDDRIILETDTGFLTYDADGAGGAAGLRIARLGVGTAVTADDFLIV